MILYLKNRAELAAVTSSQTISMPAALMRPVFSGVRQMEQERKAERSQAGTDRIARR